MTKSPTVMVPAATPSAAITIIPVIPRETITVWPMLSSERLVRLRTAALSYCCRAPSKRRAS